MRINYIHIVLVFLIIECMSASARMFLHDVITEKTDSLWTLYYRYSEDVDTVKYIDLSKYRDLPNDSLKSVDFEGVNIHNVIPWSFAPMYLQGSFPAKLGKTKYVIGFMDTFMPTNTTEVYPLSKEFRVGDLNIGDEVDTSAFKKKYTPVFIGEYSYNIPGTHWYFAVKDGKIYKFWGYLDGKMVDEVMIQNE